MMDCQDVRSLLAFTRNGGDQIDPTERAAVQHHLDGCGDCAVAAQSEELLDAALGRAMRAVTVPTGGKARLLAKLAANRPWPWAKLVAAAALLLALGWGGITWLMQPLPHVNNADFQVVDFAADKVEDWYRNRGVDMVAWRQLDHNYLWTYDIVEIQRRRVPKLIFCRTVGNNNDRIAVAQVIVLRADRFNTTDLRDMSEDAKLSKVFVERGIDPDWIYVVSTTEGDLNAFLIHGAN